MLVDDVLATELHRAKQRRSLPEPALRRVIRERTGLTQAALARALGVDRATVSRWESGERVPRDTGAYLAALERIS